MGMWPGGGWLVAVLSADEQKLWTVDDQAVWTPGSGGEKKQKVWTGRSRRVGIWAGRHVGSMSAGGHE